MMNKKPIRNGAAKKAPPMGIGGVLANVILWMASISCIYPIVWLIYSSFKTQAEFDANSIALPKSPTFDNIIHVFTISKMPRYMLNSLIISVLSVGITLLLSFVIGYFLSRFEFKGRTFLYAFFLIGMLIPIHSLMVPMYVLFTKLNLTDHWFTLIIPYVAFQMPIAIYLSESYIRSIPKEMEAAAAIDGSSFTRTLFTIILPMAKPILTTAGIITFFYCWNEFSFALILTSKEYLRTVPLGLTLFKGSYMTNYPVMMASMVVAILPSLIVYGLFSKNIIKSMVAGAVKG